MRDFSPGPIASTYAMSAPNASMSRKSRDSESGTATRAQVAPPSTVRTTVPLLPLAQATVSLTALTPRRRSVVGLA